MTKPFSTRTGSQAQAPSVSSSSLGRGKGLQLGGASRGKANNSAIADFAKELEDEISMPGGDNPWGNDDLMDVNADQDDWSESGRAPHFLL